MNQPPLFKRDPVTIAGYEPFYTYEQCLMGYTVTKVQVGRGGPGFGCFDEDDRRESEPAFQHCHTVIVAGHKIQGGNEHHFYEKYPPLEVVAHICNEFLANKENENRFVEPWQLLTRNAKELNNSKRYWLAKLHLSQIEQTRQKIRELQHQIERADYVASINAVGVLEQRTISFDERQQLWAEFSGGLPFNRD